MKKRPFFKSLHGKLTLQTLVVGLLPVIVVGMIAYGSLTELTQTAGQRLNQSRLELSRDVVGANLSASARMVARHINAFMGERILDAQVWAKTPNVIRAARGAANAHKGRGYNSRSIQSVEAEFRVKKSLDLYPGTNLYLQQQIELSPHFGEVFFTDAYGFNVALTNPTSDFVQSDENWWREAWRDGLHVGKVEFDESAGIWSVDVSVRIDDLATNARLGVLKAVLGVSLIQEVATMSANEIRGGEITVTTSEGLLLAETRSDHSRDRIMNPKISMRNSARKNVQTAYAGQDRGYVLGQGSVLGYARLQGTSNQQNLEWVVLVEQPTAIAFAPIRGLAVVQKGLEQSKQTLIIVLVTAVVLVALISLVLAHLMSRKITAPLMQLRDSADRASRGDISHSVNVDSDDEIRDLAIAFERMRKSIAIAIRKIREARKQRVT